ncbi:MAG: hypothetical protein ACHQEA_02625 [Gaiellales bacterium]
MSFEVGQGERFGLLGPNGRSGLVGAELLVGLVWGSVAFALFKLLEVEPRRRASLDTFSGAAGGCCLTARGRPRIVCAGCRVTRLPRRLPPAPR